jgi:hypothetical protein
MMDEIQLCSYQAGRDTMVSAPANALLMRLQIVTELVCPGTLGSDVFPGFYQVSVAFLVKDPAAQRIRDEFAMTVK